MKSRMFVTSQRKATDFRGLTFVLRYNVRSFAASRDGEIGPSKLDGSLKVLVRISECCCPMGVEML